MRARKAFSLLILPVVLPLLGPTAQAAPDESRSIAADAPLQAASSAAPSAPVGLVDGAAHRDGFGVAMSADQLDEHRGGDALIGQNYLTGAVSANLASDVTTGSNSITDGSFANSSGLPTVIQNTGANVLIQNATVLNVRFGN